MRDFAQNSGTFVMLGSLALGLWTVSGELWDRVALNRKKQGLEPLFASCFTRDRKKARAKAAWHEADKAQDKVQSHMTKKLKGQPALTAQAEEAVEEIEENMSMVTAEAAHAAAQQAKDAKEKMQRMEGSLLTAQDQMAAADTRVGQAKAKVNASKAAVEEAEKEAREMAAGRPAFIAALRTAGDSVGEDEVADFLLSAFGAKLESEAEAAKCAQAAGSTEPAAEDAGVTSADEVADFAKACWEEAKLPPIADHSQDAAKETVAAAVAAAAEATAALAVAKEEAELCGPTAASLTEQVKAAAAALIAAEQKASKVQEAAGAQSLSVRQKRKAAKEAAAREASTQKLQAALVEKATRLAKEAAKAQREADSQKGDDAVLADFVAELMDLVVPKSRSTTQANGPHSINVDAFLVMDLNAEDGQGRVAQAELDRLREDRAVSTGTGLYAKMFPLDEIEHLLFSHAALKRNLVKVHESLYAHWKFLSAQQLYSSVMHDSFLSDGDLQKDVVDSLSMSSHSWYLQCLPPKARAQFAGVMAQETTHRGTRIFHRHGEIPDVNHDNEDVWQFVQERIADSSVYTDPPDSATGVPDSGPAAMAAEVGDDVEGALLVLSDQGPHKSKRAGPGVGSKREGLGQGATVENEHDKKRALNWGRRALGRKVAINGALEFGGPPLDYRFQVKKHGEPWEWNPPDYSHQEGSKRRAVQSVWVRVCLQRKATPAGVGLAAVIKMKHWARKAKDAVAVRRGSAPQGVTAAPDGNPKQPQRKHAVYASASGVSGASGAKACAPLPDHTHTAREQFERDPLLRQSIVQALCGRLNDAITHTAGADSYGAGSQLAGLSRGLGIEAVDEFPEAPPNDTGDLTRPLQTRISELAVSGVLARCSTAQDSHNGSFYVRLDFFGGLLDDFTGKADADENAAAGQFPVTNSSEDNGGTQTHCRRSIALTNAVREALSPEIHSKLEAPTFVGSVGADVDNQAMRRSTFAAEVLGDPAYDLEIENRGSRHEKKTQRPPLTLRVDWRYHSGEGAGVFGQFDTLGDAQRLRYLWTDRVGRARKSEVSSWFTHKEAFVRQGDYVHRRQVLIDWMMHPDTQAELVDTMHKAVQMLISEYLQMISVPKSNVLELGRCSSSTQVVRVGHDIASAAEAPLLEPLTPAALASASLEQQKNMVGERLYPFIHRSQPELSGKMAARLLQMDTGGLPHLLESWAKAATCLLGGPVGAACFAGDILRFQLDLCNCFGSRVTHPSKRTAWEVFLVPVGRARDPDDPDKYKVVFLEASAHGAGVAVECAVPHGLEQGLYRMELAIFKRPARWSEPAAPLHIAPAAGGGAQQPAAALTYVRERRGQAVVCLQPSVCSCPETQVGGDGGTAWANSVGPGDWVDITFSGSTERALGWSARFEVVGVERSAPEGQSRLPGRLQWTLDRPLEPMNDTGSRLHVAGQLRAVCVLNRGGQVLVQRALGPRGRLRWKSQGKSTAGPAALFVPEVPPRDGALPSGMRVPAPGSAAAGKVEAFGVRFGTLHLFRHVERAHVLVHGAVVRLRLYRARVVLQGAPETDEEESEESDEEGEEGAGEGKGKGHGWLSRHCRCRRKVVKWTLVHTISAKLVASAAGGGAAGGGDGAFQQLLCGSIVPGRGAKGSAPPVPLFNYALEALARPVLWRPGAAEEQADALDGHGSEQHGEGDEGERSASLLQPPAEEEDPALLDDPAYVSGDDGVKFVRLALDEGPAGTAPARGLAIRVLVDLSAMYDSIEEDDFERYKMQAGIVGVGQDDVQVLEHAEESAEVVAAKKKKKAEKDSAAKAKQDAKNAKLAAKGQKAKAAKDAAAAEAKKVKDAAAAADKERKAKEAEEKKAKAEAAKEKEEKEK
jgi:hypothetical protein